MNYQLALLGGVILIDGNTRVSIPFSPDNTDYQTYLKWVAEGNSPYPADSATPLPAEGTE
jgi:hypothetical protein